MKYITTGFFFLWMAAIAFGQQNLHVKLFSAVTNQPLPDVKIMIEKQVVGHTNASGEMVLENVPDKSARLELTLPNYDVRMYQFGPGKPAGEHWLFLYPDDDFESSIRHAEKARYTRVDIKRPLSEYTDAEFPGGLDSMAAYLKSAVIYPRESIQNGCTGKVMVCFSVQTDGNVTGVNVVLNESKDKLLEKEAERVIRNMPDWKPAVADGILVTSYFQLPVNFQLD